MSAETSTQPIVDAEPPVEAPVEAEVPKDAEENKVEPAVPSEAPAENVEEKDNGSNLTIDDDAIVNPTQDAPIEKASDSAEDEPKPTMDADAEKQGTYDAIKISINYPKIEAFLSEPEKDDTKVSENSKESDEAAASRPATPSKADADSIVHVKRSISDAVEPTVPAKVMKV